MFVIGITVKNPKWLEWWILTTSKGMERLLIKRETSVVSCISVFRQARLSFRFMIWNLLPNLNSTHKHTSLKHYISRKNHFWIELFWRKALPIRCRSGSIGPVEHHGFPQLVHPQLSNISCICSLFNCSHVVLYLNL